MRMTVGALLEAVEHFAAPRWAFSGDRIGLNFGDSTADVHGVTVCLDVTFKALESASASGHNVIVCHHPLLWDPTTSINDSFLGGQLALELGRRAIHVIAAHTNWDAAPGGINDTLASRLGLENVEPFGWGADVPQMKFITFAPDEHVDGIIQALSEVGLGAIGEYDRCAFLSSGTGTYRPGPNASPTIGPVGQIAQTPEVKIEMSGRYELAEAAKRALRAVHPYEEPAFDIVQLAAKREMPFGRIGNLSRPMDVDAFCEHVSSRLGCKPWIWNGLDGPVERVGLVGGAADGDWPAAKAAGAQAYLTGEVKHYTGVCASESGMLMVAAGHFETEHPGMETMADELEARLGQIPVAVFNPRLAD